MSFLATTTTTERIVKWDDDTKQEGYLVTSYGQSSVYSRKRAIELSIYNYLTLLVSSPKEWLNGEELKMPRGALEWLGRAEPQIEWFSRPRIYKQIVELTTPIVKNSIDQIQVDESSSDFVFLAKLSSRRNWKSGCAVCLTDNIMGTACTCGHTEIAVFRPCGHAMCAKPCFYEYIKTKNNNTKLEAKTLTTKDGMVFTIPSQLNIDMKNPGFNCYLCNQEVESVFRAEDVAVGSFLKKDIQQIA